MTEEEITEWVNNAGPKWTPAMQEWLDEVVSRMPPQLTVRQLDIIRPLARKVANRGGDDVGFPCHRDRQSAQVTRSEV